MCCRQFLYPYGGNIMGVDFIPNSARHKEHSACLSCEKWLVGVDNLHHCNNIDYYYRPEEGVPETCPLPDLPEDE